MSNQSLFATTSANFTFPDRSTPTDRNSPIEPIEPIEPTTPNRPTEPNDPTEPASPAFPTEPTEPTSIPDPGETFADALDLGIFNGDGSVSITEGLDSSDPLDMFQFSIDQSNNFSFTLDGLSADADLYIFDENHELLGASENYNLDSEVLSGNLSAGTYFVGVASFDNLDTGYDLIISGGNDALSSLEASSSIDPISMSQDFSLM